MSVRSETISNVAGPSKPENIQCIAYNQRHLEAPARRSKEYLASVYVSSTKRKKRKISTKFHSKNESDSENPGPSLLIPLFHPSLQSYSYSAFSPSACLSWSGFGSSGPVFSTTGDTSASVTSTSSSAFAGVSMAVSVGAAIAGAGAAGAASSASTSGTTAAAFSSLASSFYSLSWLAPSPASSTAGGVAGTTAMLGTLPLPLPRLLLPPAHPPGWRFRFRPRAAHNRAQAYSGSRAPPSAARSTSWATPPGPAQRPLRRRRTTAGRLGGGAGGCGLGTRRGGRLLELRPRFWLANQRFRFRLRILRRSRLLLFRLFFLRLWIRRRRRQHTPQLRPQARRLPLPLCRGRRGAHREAPRALPLEHHRVRAAAAVSPRRRLWDHHVLEPGRTRGGGSRRHVSSGIRGEGQW
ncbi:hypothetical protein B0H14DRAFT_893339 [Mycena olivaceomarginata]|nr:hypothetical protein B0H14DRAFT_893339 [Mycena olivaceomarginata]